MNKVKYLFIILFAFLLISCGKNDENESDNTGDDNKQTMEQQTTNDKEQLGSDSNVKSEEETKTDTGKSSGELKFYSNTKPEEVVSPLQAKSHLGSVVTVKGFVAEVRKTEKVAYLNFVEKFPENSFSGVIFANRFKDFGDITVYEGRNVELTGRVTVYKGRPQIIMDSKEQIKILN
jgi:DNA/RNA endonuclease YhcR with UshA esterase domain